jgi:hypothetical protein
MKFVWLILLPMLVGAVSLPAGAQNATVSEVALKSTLFFKLPQFVYRPDDPRDRALAVCLLGSNPYGSAFERLAQTPIDGRPVQYLRLATTSEAGRCDFLFITQIEASQMETVLRKLASLPVVSVSDIPGFAKLGGMVELAMGAPGAPVSILINRKAARQQNIEFNAQLLRLARVVEP